MTGTLSVLNRSGDTRLQWTDEVETQAKARAEFGKMLEQAYFAVATSETGERTLINEFDPTAKEITMIPRAVGG